MSTFLNNDTPEGVGGLFFDVMSHSHKFGDVTTDFGAAAFNRDFLAKPLPEHAAELRVPLTIEVIDVVKRKETIMEGFGSKEHIEYIIKIARGQQLKTIGKRYSELATFHQLLAQHQLIDRVRAPPFPEKQTFRDGWYTFNNNDVGSDFIRARKSALDQYLKRLFAVNPALYHEPCVVAFFSIEDFESAAAKEVSEARAAIAAREEKDESAKLVLAPNVSGLYDV
ncbi:Phox homologous domain-containing protein [Pelagophyceae sp. CCMP2097]|nr:Phox homologous domain-containing protein [Pelagophyceae sp. CCMP2097]